VPLKLKLKPSEKITIGGCVIQNGGAFPTTLLLLNNVAVLREKDIVNPENAVTVGQKLYWAISELYVDSNSYRYLSDAICALLRIYISENRNAPIEIFDAIGDICLNLAEGDYYRALKCNKSLIAHEVSQKAQSATKEQT